MIHSCMYIVSLIILLLCVTCVNLSDIKIVMVIYVVMAFELKVHVFHAEKILIVACMQILQ